MDLMKDAGLSVAEYKLAASAINSYGKGGHPMADAATIGSFGTKYTVECLDRAATDSAKCNMGSVVEKGKLAEALSAKLSKQS